jgi:nucleotide-binding universal stress UspA family protein
MIWKVVHFSSQDRMDTKIKTIVFPVDFSERCQQAAVQIEGWARHFSATVVAVNVIDPKILYSEPARQEDTFLAEWPNLAARAEVDLQYFCDHYLQQCSNRKLVMEGDTADNVVALVVEESADLVMFPRSHQSLGSRWLRDSLSARVLDKCPAPVWTTEHPESLLTSLPKNVLCAVHVLADIRQDAEINRMLTFAKLISMEFGAKLTILHVGMPDEGTDRGPADGYGHRDISARLSTIRREMQGVASFERVSGDIKAAIVEAANRLSADLILVGRTRPGSVGLGLQGHLLAVNHSAQCPIISVG